MQLKEIKLDKYYRTIDVIEFIYGERSHGRRQNIMNWRSKKHLRGIIRKEGLYGKVYYVFRGDDLTSFILKYPTVVPEERREKVIEYLNELVKE